MATAIAVSQQAFPAAASAAAVVLARADTFPDALAGAPLAAKKGGPLLLTATDALDARTETEIKRVLGAGKTVYLLGNALTTAVANQLGSDGFTTVRYGGATRFDTAVVIADQGLGNPSKLFLATGLNFPDALAGGPPAVSVGGAILLTTDATLHASTRAYLNAHTGATRYALGSQAAQADPGATPYAGADRYATALSVAQAFFNTPAAVGLASGASFADALPAGPHLGTLKGPLLLTDGATLTPGFTSYLQARKQGIGPAFVYGGTTRISENAKNSMSQALS
jgi:putative cell wall-binding protein